LAAGVAALAVATAGAAPELPCAHTAKIWTVAEIELSFTKNPPTKNP
jgi:hypothetical protein